MAGIERIFEDGFNDDPAQVGNHLVGYFPAVYHKAMERMGWGRPRPYLSL